MLARQLQDCHYRSRIRHDSATTTRYTRASPHHHTERIVEAGIEIGLPSITFIGVAAALGVSHMALYKHIANLDALKSMVAEEIFTRWQIPRADADRRGGLKEYMIVFATSVRVFVKAHPG